MSGLDFVIELSSFQKLYDNIDGVLTFINFKDLHQVSMIEFSHKFNFLY